MSSTPDSELDLDLQFLPEWATQSPAENPYNKFEAKPDKGGRKGPDKKRFVKGDRPGGRPGPRPDRKPFQGKRDPRRGPTMQRRRELPPLPEINVTFIPEPKGVDSLVRQIKLTGRAYPMFDIARLILKKPDRFILKLETIRKPDGTVAHPLFSCDLDKSIWLREQEAMDHVLKRHFETFYQPEKKPTDPPKGKYTFVAQCGYSQIILGPPNYHDYQNKLRRLHKERFGHIPFEAYKSRVRIVKDEEVVNKWVEEQSFKTEYICLNVPEPLQLDSFEAVQKHFRETHLANIVKRIDEFEVTKIGDRESLPGPLKALVHKSWDEQKRYPLKVVTQLSQQFAAHALQFFKVNKTVTHVSVARPQYLDMEVTPVSEGVRKIVQFVDSTPRCTRKILLETLAQLNVSEGQVAVKAGEAGGEETIPVQKVPTPEQSAIISDLHWLIHQGHVIEYSTGQMDIAAKPKKPEKPAPAPEAKKDATSEESVTTKASSTPTSEADSPKPADSPTSSVAATEAKSESVPENLGEPSSATEPEPTDAKEPKPKSDPSVPSNPASETSSGN